MFIIYLYLAAAIVGYAEVAEFLFTFNRNIKKEGYKYSEKDINGKKPGIIDFFKENKDYVIGPILPIANFPFVFFLFYKRNLNIHKLKSMYIKDEKIYIPDKGPVLSDNKKERSKTKEIPTPQVTVGMNKVLKKSLKRDNNRY